MTIMINGQMLHLVQHFCRGSELEKLIISFRGSKYLPNIQLNKIQLCVFSQY